MQTTQCDYSGSTVVITTASLIQIVWINGGLVPMRLVSFLTTLFLWIIDTVSSRVRV